MVVAVILAAVGVPIDVIAADYALSAERFAEQAIDEHFDGWRAGPVAVDSPPEYMMTVLDDLEERHGGATGLLARQSIREVDLQELHELLTEQVG